MNDKQKISQLESHNKALREHIQKLKEGNTEDLEAELVEYELAVSKKNNQLKVCYNKIDNLKDKLSKKENQLAKLKEAAKNALKDGQELNKLLNEANYKYDQLKEYYIEATTKLIKRIS